MGDTVVTIIVIVLGAVLMFVFPLMSVADRSDDVSQLSVQSATTTFVDGIRSTGRITLDNYNKFVQEINSTGNTYDVVMEVKILDENPGKKVTWTSGDKIGENIYYSQYTSQILEQLENGDGEYILSEGDMISVSVKNTNQTLSQMLRNFFYTISGQDTYQVAAEHSKMVTVTGK